MPFRRKIALLLAFCAGLASASAETGTSYAPDEVLVRFRPAAGAAAAGLGVQSLSSLPAGAASALQSVGATQISPLGAGVGSVHALSAAGLNPFEPLSRTYRVRLPAGSDIDAAVATLSANASVEVAEPNVRLSLLRTANDPYMANRYDLKNTGQLGTGLAYDPFQFGTSGKDIDAELAWNVTTGTGSLIVAVIDSGVDYNHPDLIDNIWTNTAEANGAPGVDEDGNGYYDDARGWDFGDWDGNPTDNCGSLALGEGHGTHVAGIIGASGNNGLGAAGVAWDVRIMPLKVANTGCFLDTADVVQAIQYATANGAKIINMSLGGGDSTTFHAACDAAKAAGVTLVAAAGNGGQGSTPNSPLYPAGYSSVIAVAATDRRDARAAFSTYGTFVTLSAPGVAIRSTFPTGDGSYEYLSGTSMATPLVSGTAALVLSQYPTSTPDQVRARLVNSCEALGSSGMGAGRVNAARALMDFTGVSPTVATAGLPVTFTLTGTSFQPGMDVQLTRSGFSPITATSVNVIDHQNATCVFNVPTDQMGVWSIRLAIGQTLVPAAATILFEGVVIDAASPNVWPSTAPAGPVVLLGRNFGPTLSAYLSRSGQSDIPSSSLTVLTATAAVATFDVTGAVGGRWDVVVSSGGQTSALKRGLAVTTPQFRVVEPPPGAPIQFVVPMPQGNLTLDWPAETAATPVLIDIDADPDLPPLDRARDPYVPTGIGVGLEIVGGPSIFDRDFRLTLPYRLTDLLDASGEGSLTLGYYNETTRRWQPIGDCSVDEDLRTVSGSAAHFSHFQLLQHVPSATLAQVVAYPSPFRPDRGHDRIVFDFLTAGATVKVFDLSGALVRELNDDDGDGRIDWIGVTTEGGEKVASGIYYYVVTGAGGTRTGRLAVIR